MAPNSNVISDTELFWSLVDKADRKFSKLRDSPSFGRNMNESDFQKAFKIYTRLWKMQQEHRQKLLEAGLKRWEVGEIASRIAQLYYGQYLRTSDSGYLRECYIFYEALLEREYFKDGATTGQAQLPPQQELGLTKKQLRFLARFIVVCLVMGRREMTARLASQLRTLVEESKKYFKEVEQKEWKLVVHEIHRFLKVDALTTSTRPLRYSFVFDSHPDALPYVTSGEAKKGLKLSDAILCSYHHNEIKFKELSLDTFRIIQSLEWEPSGSFSLPIEQDAGEKTTTHNPLKDIRDPTLPPNPRKAVLYRPSVSHFLLVLATLSEELPPNGILLLYLSAAEDRKVPRHRSSGSLPKCSENTDQPASSISDTTSESSSSSSSSTPSSRSKGNHEGFIYLGSQGDGGLCRLYPCDLIPFTRKPLFLIIDSSASYIFKNIHGTETGETTAMILSPKSHFPTSIGDSFQIQYGSSFTMFLTSPLQAFCLLFGTPTYNKDKDAYSKAEKILSSLLIEWGLILAKSDVLHPVWVEVLGDPFLRRFLLRFVFCRSVIALSNAVSGQAEYIPECLPPLPDSVLPNSAVSQAAIMQLAKFFDVTHHFQFGTGTLSPFSDVHEPSNGLDFDMRQCSLSSHNRDES